MPSGLAIAIDLVTPGHIHIVAARRIKQSLYISLLETMFEEAKKITNIQLKLQLNKNKLGGKRA